MEQLVENASNTATPEADSGTSSPLITYLNSANLSQRSNSGSGDHRDLRIRECPQVVATTQSPATVTEQQVPRGKAATHAVTWKFPNREKYKKTRLSIQGLKHAITCANPYIKSLCRLALEGT